MREPPVTAAIKAAGSVAALARLLDIKPQAVSQWSKVPLERLLEVERATGISRVDLRPDLFDGIPPSSADVVDQPQVAA